MFDFSFIQKIYFPDSVLALLQKSYSIYGFFIDFWLIPHFMSGLTLGYLSDNFKILKNWMFVISLFILFEIVENGILYKQGLTEYEPISNSILDIVVSLTGWWFVGRWEMNRQS